MKIALHDAEKEHFKNKNFPNFALMKISAYHKGNGDSVEWWNPLYKYDRVYSSKVLISRKQIRIFLQTQSGAAQGIGIYRFQTNFQRILTECFLTTQFIRNVILLLDISQEDASGVVAGVWYLRKRVKLDHTWNGKTLCGLIQISLF